MASRRRSGVTQGDVVMWAAVLGAVLALVHFKRETDKLAAAKSATDFIAQNPGRML